MENGSRNFQNKRLVCSWMDPRRIVLNWDFRSCRWTATSTEGYFDNTFLYFVISQTIDHDREWGEGRRAAEYSQLPDDNTRGTMIRVNDRVN